MDLYAILILIPLPLLIIVRLIYIREKLSHMTAMTIAMALGMSMGLTAGTLVGLLHPEQTLFATVVGMLAGLSIGVISGMPFSLVAVLDGFLSGVMGGMMGAMLGIMLPHEDAAAAIKIMILLYLAVMAIVFMVLPKIEGAKKRLFYNSLTVTGLALVFFIFNFSNNPLSPSQMSMNSDTGKNINITINAEDYRFSPNKIKVKRNQTLTLVLNNTDTMDHDLKIIGATPTSFKIVKTTAHMHHHANDTVIHSAPGQKQTMTIIPEQLGTFTFICTEPGHKKAGMVGEIIVVPGTL